MDNPSPAPDRRRKKAPTHAPDLIRDCAGFLTEAGHAAAHARDCYRERAEMRANQADAQTNPDRRAWLEKLAGRDHERASAADRLRELAHKMSETARQLAGTERADQDPAWE